MGDTDKRWGADLGLGGSEGAAESLLQRVQEGLDLVEALAAVAGAEGYDVEVLEDPLKASLAHLGRDAFVAEEAGAPDAEHGLAVLNAGGGHKPQEGLHLRRRHALPALVTPVALLVLLGIHVGLRHHVLDDIVWHKELEEVQGSGIGWHLLCGTYNTHPVSIAITP